VVIWNLVYSKYALTDAKKLTTAGLKDKGAYSRRINIQHRLVYEIFRKEKTVRVLRMWSHYE
jgi:toxin YoeB